MGILANALVKESDVALFWAKVDCSAGENSCWPWLTGRTKDGYGVATRNGRSFLAHRLSWMIRNNLDPKKKHILHRCDNPICVNPKHLQIGTHSENMADMVAKGRQSQGEHKKSAKLTAQQVLEIQSLLGVVKRADIAKRYGVGLTTIGDIARGKKWKSVTKGASNIKRCKKDDCMTEEKVREIKKLLKIFSALEVSKKLKIEYKRVWRISAGKTYKNII